LATDIPTFKHVALDRGNDGLTKLERFQQEGKVQDVKFTVISHGVENGKEYGTMSINWKEGVATVTTKS
jgi:hypothetical protein